MCLLSWYPSISSHWLDMSMIHVLLALGRIWVWEIPNHTFLVLFSGISGSVDLAIGNLAGLHHTKIETMASPISPDMPPEHTRKVWLGVNGIYMYIA